MKTKLHMTLLLFFAALMMLQAQPANDDCTNAQNISVTTEFQVVTFDLTDAAINNESACSGDGLDDFVDVWFQFVMPTSGNLYINGSVSNNGFNIYDSCNGTEFACFNTNEYVENLVEGNTYLLRVRRWLPQNIENFQEFFIYALEPLTNDTCSNSENIVVDNTLQTVNFNTVQAETNNEIGCEGEPLDDSKDVWYNFTMPASGTLEIAGGTLNRFALYDTCNGTQIACFDGEGVVASYFDDLTPNENYTLRVFRSNLLNNPNNQSFTIRVVEPTYPSCSDIEMLAITTSLQTVNIDLNNSTYEYELGCNENDADQYANFWYEFTMPVNGNLYISSSKRNRVAIFDSCGGNLLNCYDSSMENALKKIIEDLVQGETYIIRIYRPINTPSTSLDEEFKIRAFERLSNDNCATPEIITGLTSDNTQILFPLAGGNVTTADTCEGITDGIIVEAFWQITMPITGNLFIDTPSGNGIAIYDACNGNELFCNASEGTPDSFKLISNLIEGNTYIIRCFNTEQGISEDNQQALNIRVYDRAANDECLNAEIIPTITTTSQEITFDTFGSLINLEESCLGQSEENFVDVWFEFTMPNFTYLNFESYVFNFFVIYDACNGNEIDCFAGNEVLEGLVPNQNYVLRVFQRQNLEMFHPNKFFNIYGSETLSNPETELEDVKLQMSGQRTLMINHLQTSAELHLYNMLGQKIISKKIMPSNKQFIELNVPTGIYIVHLDQGHSIETLKIIVRN